MDEPKQKIKPVVRGIHDAVAEEVLSARNLPAGIVRGSIPEAAEMTTDRKCIMRCQFLNFSLFFPRSSRVQCPRFASVLRFMKDCVFRRLAKRRIPQKAYQRVP